MTVNQLIERLNEIQPQYGDLPVTSDYGRIDRVYVDSNGGDWEVVIE